jgi:hypothetical protein
MGSAAQPVAKQAALGDAKDVRVICESTNVAWAL